MSFNLRNRSLLTRCRISPNANLSICSILARDLKRAKYARTEQQHLKGKEIVLIFEKKLDAHTLRLRGRLLRSGRERHVSRSFRLANRP